MTEGLVLECCRPVWSVESEGVLFEGYVPEGNVATEGVLSEGLSSGMESSDRRSQIRGLSSSRERSDRRRPIRKLYACLFVRIRSCMQNRNVPSIPYKHGGDLRVFYTVSDDRITLPEA